MKQRILIVLLALTGVPLAWADAPGASAEDTTVSLTPTVRYVTVKGDEKRFRQDWWIQDGWTGGLEEMTLERALGHDWKLHMDGRAIFDEEDYALRLEIVNPNVGFVRAGYEEFRKYYDDSGGYYPFASGARSFSLWQDLHLDIGSVFIEAGLTLPNMPRLTLGYEYKFKDGEKSMVEWGTAQRGSVQRNILPASKDINDRVHIVKLEMDHDIRNIHIGDQFRYERYEFGAVRQDDTSWIVTNAAPAKSVTVNESYQHDAFFNTFYVDSHLNEKIFWSLGYLFSTLNGDPGFSMNTEVFPANGGTSSSTDKFWEILRASISQDSHLWNANAMLGPFFGKSTSFYGGLQAEKTETKGFSDANWTETGSPTEAAVIHSSNDKKWLEERIGVRFTKIPFTTLYAEGKWSQGDIALDEAWDVVNPTEEFVRRTDTDVDRQDYRVGFSSSPFARMTLGGYYRRSQRDNEYNHLVDEVDGLPQTGYSAFITGQRLTTDEVGARLTLRPCSKFNLSLKYQLVATDFETSFASTNLSQQTGNFNSQVYSVSATVTPLSRLYLTGLLSCQNTRTIGQDNGSAVVLTYHGNVYSSVAALGYALDDQTDLRAEYTFSRADNFEDNSSVGIPYGLDYKRHSVLVSLSRQLGKNVVGRLAYGFYDYDESSSASINDYTAHMGSASVAIRF